MTSDIQLGNLIRRRRIERGWSQVELAKRIVSASGHAIKQSDISRIERGEISLPRFERLQAFSRVLDIPIGELILAATGQERGLNPHNGKSDGVLVDRLSADRATNQR